MLATNSTYHGPLVNWLRDKVNVCSTDGNRWDARITCLTGFVRFVKEASEVVGAWSRHEPVLMLDI